MLGNSLPIIGNPFADPSGVEPLATAVGDSGTQDSITSQAADPSSELARLVVEGLPQGATIVVDGQIRQDTSIPVLPREHFIVWQASGFQTDSQTVSVRQSQRLTLTFAGKPAPVSVAPSVVSQLEIAPTEIILRVGETQSLLATVYDDSGNVARSRLTYVSSDVRVASVTWNENRPNIAVVTGVSTGTAEIEVRSDNPRGLARVAVQVQRTSLTLSQCVVLNDSYNADGSCFDTQARPLEATLVPLTSDIQNTPSPVTLGIKVNADGSVAVVQVVTASNNAYFTVLALEFAKNIEYSPATKEGDAVAAWTRQIFFPRPR